jgi:hypothetical protein
VTAFANITLRCGKAFGAAILAFPLLLTCASQDAVARPPAPWCAYLSGDWGIDCSYRTFEQCREFISGVGGYCSLNPYLAFVGERPGYGKRRAPKQPR